MLRSLTLAVLLSLASLARAEAVTPTALPEAVLIYAKVLNALERADAPTAMEPLFLAGEDAQNALMRIAGDQALLEGLSDAEFAQAQAVMRGYALSRGYDIYALPRTGFFADLARLHGKPEDQRFFSLIQQAEGENFLPLYLKEKIPTPCVRYGEGMIGELYESWKSYAKAWPKAYTAPVQQSLRDLEEVVALGTCACGTMQSVQSEQRQFLRRFPKNPVVKEIRARMRQLDRDPEVQPVNCR